MSWQIVSAGSLLSSAAASLTLSLSSARAPGDLMVACVSSRGAVPYETPDGWTEIQSLYNGNTSTSGVGSDAASGVMLYRICEEGDAAPVFVRTGGDVGYGLVLIYRHTSPITLGNSGITQLESGATTITLSGGVDTTQDNELLVACLCGGDNDLASGFVATDPSTASGLTDSTTDPTNAWIERADSTTTGGADTSLAVADAVKPTAGNTGPISATHARPRRHVLIVASFRAGDAPVRRRSPLLLMPW